MMFDASALEFFANLAKASQAVEKLGSTPDGRETRYRVGGALQTVAERPPARNHRAYSLADLIAFADDHRGEDHVQAVWHGPESVTLILDDGDRCDRVTFVLTWSVPFAILRQLDQVEEDLVVLGAPNRLRQKNFVRLLDVTLGVNKALVAPWRALDWQSHMAARGEIQAGRDRLGREIEAKVAGTSELPDEITIVCPVYREPGERDLVSVRCRIEIFPGDESLALTPIPGEVDAATDLAQGSIHDRLVEGLGKEARVYYGAIG